MNEEYFNQMFKNFGRCKPYHYSGPRCTSKCKRYPAYETDHDPACPFYKGSLSELRNTEIANLKEALAAKGSQE